MKSLPMLPSNEVIAPLELRDLAEARTALRQSESELIEEWNKPLTFRGRGIYGDLGSGVSVASGILWIQGPMGPSLCYHKPRKQTKPQCKCVVCGAVHNRKGG